jgi:hypothetical protein
MNMRSLIVIILLISAGPAIAQELEIPTELQLTVIVEPQYVMTAGAYVQGQINLRVVLVSPHPFEELNLALPTIDHVRVHTLVPPSTRQVRFYNLLGYAYETRLALFPERSGTLVIPPVAVSGEVATGPDQRERFDLQHPETVIEVRAIDPAFPSAWWLVSEDVTFEESWTPAPEQFRVGATVQRHVTLTAKGVSVEQLPNFEQSESQGYAVVGKTVKNNTALTKDGLVSTVRQTWELRILSGDVFDIAPMRINYWNPVTEQPATATLPPRRVEPLVRDAGEARAALIDTAVTTHENRRAGIVVLMALPALAACLLFGAFLIAALPTRADRRLRRRCNANATAEDSLAAILAWSRESFGFPGGTAFAGLRVTLGPRAAAALVEVQNSLYTPDLQSFAPRQVARTLVSSARRQRISALRRRLCAPIHAYFAAPRLQ